MDFGYRAEDILWLVEDGLLTLGYQSSSYLTDRVPELGFVDLPFLFEQRDRARAAMDGALGRFLGDKIEERVNYRILGWFENGFRQISNRLRTVHPPADLKGMRIRVLPSEVQARTFALLGAVPLRWDLTEAIDRHQGRHHRRAGKPVRQYRDLWRAQVSPFPHRDQPLLHFAADFSASPGLRWLATGFAARHARGHRARRRIPARFGHRGRPHGARRDPRRGLRDHRADRRPARPVPRRRGAAAGARRAVLTGKKCSIWSEP